MSTNKLRAEKILNFPNDKSYKAKMSLDTVIRIEQSLGFSILKFGNRLASTDATLTECIQVLTLALRSGGNDLKDNDVKELVQSMGLLETIKTTGDLVSLALDIGEPELEKKSESQT